jgi:hypothetical protein
MGIQSKALKAHRKRLHSRGLKRVEVTVRAEHVSLLRDVAAKLRAGHANVKRFKAALKEAETIGRGKSLAEALYDPVVAAPEFDEVFDEIERSRRDPAMLKMREIDL